MFFLGSASCLSKKCDIEEEELGRAVLEIMKGYGLSHENAMHFIASYDELLSEPLGKEAFQEGFHAMKDFLEGNDVNSPLRLRHLVERWADL